MISTVLARLVEEPGVLVVGPSGCGKSSLVGAGVVPGLRSLQDPPLVTTMVPGPDPFAALVQALEMVATNPDADARDLVDAGSGLAELTAALCPGARVTLVVDQLEELFTLCPANESEAFLALLAGALSTTHREMHCPAVDPGGLLRPAAGVALVRGSRRSSSTDHVPDDC